MSNPLTLGLSVLSLFIAIAFACIGLFSFVKYSRGVSARRKGLTILFGCLEFTGLFLSLSAIIYGLSAPGAIGLGLSIYTAVLIMSFVIGQLTLSLLDYLGRKT